MAISIVLCLFASSNSYADNQPAEQFWQGMKYYTEGQYDAAISAFSEAIKINPGVSEYHHWLGKSYGQLAQDTGMIKALELSNKTRQSLEYAVSLDDTNIEALSDLLKYYEQAPSFLGGGQEKAREIRKRLLELDNQAGSANEG